MPTFHSSSPERSIILTFSSSILIIFRAFSILSSTSLIIVSALGDFAKKPILFSQRTMSFSSCLIFVRNLSLSFLIFLEALGLVLRLSSLVLYLRMLLSSSPILSLSNCLFRASLYLLVYSKRL